MLARLPMRLSKLLLQCRHHAPVAGAGGDLLSLVHHQYRQRVPSPGGVPQVDPAATFNQRSSSRRAASIPHSSCPPRRPRRRRRGGRTPTTKYSTVVTDLTVSSHTSAAAPA